MPLFSRSKNLEQIQFQLKLSSKQLAREALKAEKSQKAEEEKIAKAIRKGNNDGARIYAENAIRKKTEALNYLRMSSRLDAVAQRLKTAITTNAISKSMKSAVVGMDSALASMDLQKITGVMDKFESQFEDIDIHTGIMDNAMGGMAALTTPEDQVDTLINRVADQHGIEIAQDMDMGNMKHPVELTNISDAKLSEKLKELRDLED